MKILLALVLVLGAGAELVAPTLVESRIEQGIADRSGGAVTARADLDSFPFLTRLLATEEVRELTVTLEEVTGEAIRFAHVDFTVEGVTVDRSALLAGEVRIRDIDRGRVTATVTEEALSEALGHEVGLEPGQAVVVVGGTRVAAELTVRDGRLAIGAEGVTLDVGLPVAYLPCVPDADVGEGRIVLTCEVDEVPERLVEALVG